MPAGKMSDKAITVQRIVRRGGEEGSCGILPASETNVGRVGLVKASSAYPQFP
jgi:hypothetical protein